LTAHVAELFKGCAVPYQVHLLVDTAEAGEQIVRFAQRKKTDLIFLGIRRKSRVGKLLSGSNSQFIILNSPCPVMTVRRDMVE
jgi:nucleotide-binding universal stress UspA family protein